MSEIQATADPLRPANHHIFRLRIVILRRLFWRQRCSALWTNARHVARQVVLADAAKTSFQTENVVIRGQ